MKTFFTASFLLITVLTNAQVGIGTSSPNSTLDVRGSISGSYRAFSAATTAGSTDYLLVFNGTSAATLTLPDASTIQGRAYQIKNASSNSSVLTVATSSSQTIDGMSAWTLSVQNKTVILVSNGANWYAVSESTPGSSGAGWLPGGNNVAAVQNFGTTSNYALPFITNNTEKMRLSTSGSLGLGTSTFDSVNPEKMLIDAGSASSYNLITGKGTVNNYVQLNIQNRSTGTDASADVVATADNGTESVNYVDMGINSSNNSSSGLLGGANSAYLYSTGNNFMIGNSTASKDVVLFTGGTAASNEKLRLTPNGISVSGSIKVNYRSGTGAYTLLATDYVVINTGAAATWTLPAASGCAGRVYRLLNQGTGAITLSQSVRTASGTTSTSLAVGANSNFYEIMSDGTEWRRIN